jgi:hypothetical protein
MAIEEHFEKDCDPWRLKRMKIALQIGAHEAAVNLRGLGFYKFKQAHLIYAQN